LCRAERPARTTAGGNSGRGHGLSAHAAAQALAALAGALAAAATAALAREAPELIAPRYRSVERQLERWVVALIAPLRRSRSEGVVPPDRERLRLQLAAAAAGFATGLVGVGPRFALGAAAGAGWLAGHSLTWTRERYRRRLDRGASAVAVAVADALDAGRSMPGAFIAAADGLHGPMGTELRRVARELEVGAPTDAALKALQGRSGSRRVNLIAAAATVQRRSGGRLAELLREIAVMLDERDRLADEARAASAQARFTSATVVCLPLAGLVLGELAAPGLIGRMAGSPAGAWLLALALALQGVGIALIRRLARVEP
jgi:tight adherence protein B